MDSPISHQGFTPEELSILNGFISQDAVPQEIYSQYPVLQTDAFQEFLNTADITNSQSPIVESSSGASEVSNTSSTRGRKRTNVKKERRDVKTTTKGESRRPTGKTRAAPIPLSWYIDEGFAIAAEKKPNEMGAMGFEYLAKEDWDSDDFPYTVIVGKFKQQKGQFIFGRGSEKNYVILKLTTNTEGKREIVSHNSVTAATTELIKLASSSSRQSGFDNLRFRNLRKQGYELESNITLKELHRKVEQLKVNLQPQDPAVRSASELFTYPVGNETPLISNHQPVVEEVTSNIQTSGREEVNNRYSELLEMPKNMDFDYGNLASAKTIIADGLNLTNGEENMEISPANLSDLIPKLKAGYSLTEKDEQILRSFTSNEGQGQGLGLSVGVIEPMAVSEKRLEEEAVDMVCTMEKLADFFEKTSEAKDIFPFDELFNESKDEHKVPNSPNYFPNVFAESDNKYDMFVSQTTY